MARQLSKKVGIRVSLSYRLTKLKRAEETLRELESDLAHVNRVSIMGELAASLAHENEGPFSSRARSNGRPA